MTESTATVPVTATDLQVGDVIKAWNGHYYAVDTRPVPSRNPEEYLEPHMDIGVTETHADRTPVPNSAKRVALSQDAVFDVLVPRQG